MTASGDRPLTGQARAEALVSLAESLLRRGIAGSAIEILVRVENSGRCRPPLELPEVERIVEDACSKDFREEGQRESVERRGPVADPEELARVAALVAGVLQCGPANTRAIGKRVRARRQTVQYALEVLKERGEATYRLGHPQERPAPRSDGSRGRP